VTAGGALGYRWQRDGVDLADGGRVSGSATATLRISGVDAGDEASYRCVVTGASGTATSHSAGLTLREPTVIVQQPGDQTGWPLSLSPGVMFAALGSGEGAVSYRWEKDGQPLADGGSFAGTDTPALTVSPVGTPQAGWYRCIVTAGCGPVASVEARLEIISADFDADGDADQTDFGMFQRCVGVSLLQEGDPCLRMDHNNDTRVDANEDFGIKSLLKLRDRDIHNMIPALRGSVGQLVFRVEMSDVLGFDKHHPFAQAGRDSLGKRPRELQHGGAQMFRIKQGLWSAAKPLQFCQGFFEPLTLDGLEEIVNRIHLECVQREAVVRRREYHHGLSSELLENVESGHSRHLDVEEDRIDLVPREEQKRLSGVRSRTGYLHTPGFV
jgi:hypothetical protein